MINNIDFKNLYKDIEILAKELKVDDNTKLLYKLNEIITKYIITLEGLRSNIAILNKHVLRISSKPQYGPEDINKKFKIIQETQCLPELKTVNELIISWKRYLSEKGNFFNNIYLHLNWYFPYIFEDYNLILKIDEDVIVTSNIIYSLNMRLNEYKRINYRMF